MISGTFKTCDYIHGKSPNSVVILFKTVFPNFYHAVLVYMCICAKQRRIWTLLYRSIVLASVCINTFFFKKKLYLVQLYLNKWRGYLRWLLTFDFSDCSRTFNLLLADKITSVLVIAFWFIEIPDELIGGKAIKHKWVDCLVKLRNQYINSQP